MSNTFWLILFCLKFKTYSLLFLNWSDQLVLNFCFKPVKLRQPQMPPFTCRNVAYVTDLSILRIKSNPYFSNLNYKYTALKYIKRAYFWSYVLASKLQWEPFSLYGVLFFNLKDTLLLGPNIQLTQVEYMDWNSEISSLRKTFKTFLVFVPNAFSLTVMLVFPIYSASISILFISLTSKVNEGTKNFRRKVLFICLLSRSWHPWRSSGGRAWGEWGSA